jgi:curved DNA-binding protein CbpA
VDAGEAASVLGVRVGAPWAEVRAAYRRLMRANHPDVAGPDDSRRAARITEAYALLREARRAAPAPVSPRVAPIEADVVDGETIAILAPPDEAFARLLEAAHDTFDVSYVDRSTGIIEAIVTAAPGDQVSSLLITLQGRGTGVTEAFCTMEALGTGPTPPIAPVIARLLARLREPTAQP